MPQGIIVFDRLYRLLTLLMAIRAPAMSRDEYPPDHELVVGSAEICLKYAAASSGDSARSVSRLVVRTGKAFNAFANVLIAARPTLGRIT